MYEQFGPVVDHSTRTFQFRLFFPDNTKDVLQYSRGGLPRIEEISIPGTFHSGGWEVDIQRILLDICRLAQDPPSRPLPRSHSTRGLVQPSVAPMNHAKRHWPKISLGFAALFLVAGLIFISTNAMRRPIVEFSQDSINFGGVSIGATVSKDLTVRNSGKFKFGQRSLTLCK